MRFIIILTIFISGRVFASVANFGLKEDNDVLILSLLIQDHLRKTNGREINLEELLRADTLARIFSNSFEKVEFKSKGGHLSVYYKFSELRKSNEPQLLDKEKDRSKYLRWTERKMRNGYDGEIRLDYGERFYRLIRLIRKKTN